MFPSLLVSCKFIFSHLSISSCGLKAGNDATEMIKSTDENKQLTAQKEAEVQEAKSALDKRLETIGNLVHDSVPVSDDEVGSASCASCALPYSSQVILKGLT